MGIDASKSVSRFRSMLKAKREQFRRLVCEGLERRELMAVFAPGTTEDYQNSWINAHPGLQGDFGNSFKGPHGFNLLGTRWTNPTGGPSPNIGDPATVSWSIVPDGTRVGSGPTDLQASNLIAFMDGIYGTAPGPVGNRPWFKLVERAYDNWSKVTGINFVYEPNDDGVGQTNSAASRGVNGVRGDIRMGGRTIDGNNGTLAFNFDPFTGGNFGFDGDMVIDTTDNFYANSSNGATGENRGLVNVLTHEIGHGIGINHSIPINNTKLMEPNVTFAFLGVQHDDLLGAQTLYGDDFESNDSFAGATDLGTRSNGIITLNNTSVDRNGDSDVYKFTIANAGVLAVTLTPDGQQYVVGPQGGATAPVNTSLNKDLSFQVETASGVVLATVNAGAAGIAETIQDLLLPNAGTYAIRVLGSGTETQLYNLRLTLSGIAPPNGPANDTFRLLSVAPNSSEIFSNTSPNVLQESPRELVFRFDADLDRTTLRQGIRIRPAGSDKQFTSSDLPISPAFLDFGSSNRIVIARFAEPLPDDLYQVEVFGADIPTEGIRAIRNATGSQIKPRLPGSDRDTYQFNLELGPKVVAVVPQPVSRDSNGRIVQARDQIEVYFDNTDGLYPSNVRTGDVLPNPTVVNPDFYQLHADRGTVSNVDDAVFVPSSVVYDSTRNMVVLTFASNIDQIATNDTSFRLRIGTNEAKPSAPTPVVPGSEPNSTFAGAFNVGTFNALTSVEIQGQSIFNSSAFPLDFPGAPDTPGSREVDDDPSLGESHLLSDTPDTGVGLGIQRYNFNKVVQLGVDASGQPVFNSITPAQEQRAREIFEFYGSILGIHFVETETQGWTIATGSIDGPGNVLGQAGSGQAIMDAGESWWDALGASDDPAKVSWFAVAMHEIGHLLGLGHSTNLPPGSNMGGAYSFATLGGEPAWLTNRPVEPIFPGAASTLNLKYLHRPDSRDIDMYRFTVASQGEFSAEIVAERQSNSSNLDSVLTLYRENSDGTREVIAVNDDYFSEDSFLRVNLAPGVYYIGVSASGNRDFNPEITDSGLNGTSEGIYNLRTTFKPSESVSIVDVNGTKLDGDADGVQGGVYNFWFKAAAPNGEQVNQRRTLFVDKQTGSVNGVGTRANPYSRIQDAFRDAVPGDIVRIVPNAGADGNVLSQQDNLAFEVGSGGLGDQALTDGRTMDVPRGVTVMVDAGVLFKMGKSAIGVGSTTPSLDRSNAALQVLGTPERSVVFTAYTDESLGVDTNPLPTTVQSGDWGGLMFRNALDRAEGRIDAELRGQFLNYVSYADMRHGGGQVSIDGNNTIVTPLHMIAARPTLTNNTITRSASAAISADPNSFEESTFTTNRFQSDGAFTPDYSRVGPSISGNRLLNNSINGLFVRIETLPGEATTAQTVAGRWDDIDIVHVIADTLTIAGTPGGSFLETTPPELSVVSVASGGSVAGGALVPGTTYSYRMTFVDAFGNESVPSSATVPFVLTAGANAINLGGLPPARAGFVGRKIYRSDDGGVTFRLVAELDRSSTTYVDSSAQRPTVLNVSTQLQRARLDASLTIDPGLIIKSQNARFVTGVSAQLIAEGTENLPIVFTSRQDDRYGAGGTFDTNNDLSGSVPLPGDWGGLFFGHLGSGSIDHSVITFGGGTVAVGGNTAGFNAVEIHQSEVRISNSVIERNAGGTGGSSSVVRGGAGFNEPAAIFVRGSQPIIVDNIIRSNTSPAISIDAQSMSGVSIKDVGRSTGFADRLESITENKGPLVRGNSLGNNNVNGLVVRGGTLTTESVWDDTDIVHVVPHEIVVPDFYVFGGLRLQSSPNESLVVKFGPNAGLTSNGRPLDIDDRIGGILQVIGTPGFPVILTSLADDSAGAGFDPEGRAQTDTNNNGTSTLAQPGDWRSLRIAEFSNDRNVLTTVELEPAQSTGAGVNGTPSTSQSLGLLASRETASDDNLRLGFTISGTINNVDDLDVYSFRGTAGTSVWLDIDRTNISLDAVIELIDANGNIIAQSDNSFDESRGALAVFSNPSAIDGRFVNPMQTSSFSPRNGGSGTASITNTFADFYSTNPLDPGMRVVLPGVVNSASTYFVRVRSSNIDSRLPGVNRADLQDPAKVLNGKTEGQYQLQIRIQELDEFGGSSVSLSDVRFAQNGIEVLGMPGHSPLAGEAVELGTNNNTIATALDLGNLLNTDRAALSVAGDLNSLADVDFYRFQINQPSLQSNGLVQHLSTVIDVDYADGLGRANTSLWLFYDDQNGIGGNGSGPNTGIRLVAFGTDSNIADDIGAPLKGSNVDDLSRGSAGVLDAFLGNIELPSGTYYLGITSNEIVSSYLAQFYQADAGGNPLTRVEPVNSVQRIIESRFTGTATTTAAGPLQTGFSRRFVNGVEQINGEIVNAVPYTLNDVVLFVSQTAPGADNSELITINPLTGRQTSLVSRFPFVADIATRGDGTLHASRSPQTGIVNDANSGGISTIDTAGNGTTAQTTATSGIQTFELDTSVAPPAVAQALTPGAGATRAGRGMEFLGLTYPQLGNATQALYASGSRVGATTFTTAAGQRDARNYIYRLDPTSLQAVSAPFNDRTDGARLNGAGTQIVERGYVDTSTDAGARNATSQTIVMAAASSTTTPALLSGDRVVVQTPTGQTAFEWVASTLSATLVANTLPQASLVNGNPAPTNFYQDRMSFQLTAGATTRTFEIDTGRVITNNYSVLTAPTTWDTSTFTITPLVGLPRTFEFDATNAITAGNVAVVYDATNSTQFQVSQAIVNAINANNTTWSVRAALLPGTNRISITGDQGLVIPNTLAPNPLTVTQLTNSFPTLGVGQSYDGATFTVTDISGDAFTFELDSNNSFTPGNVQIVFDATTTAQGLTQAIDAAINFPTGVNPPPAPWEARSVFTNGSNTLRMLGDSRIVVSPSTATIINPLLVPTEYGLANPASGNIPVLVEEYFTNVDDVRLLPTPSTPGAMDEIVAAINNAAMGITASAIGTRLVLTGATAANVSNISTMAFNAPTSTGVPIPFNFTDSAAVLNARLLAAIRTVEPDAIAVTGNRIWLPARSSVIQLSTNDRGDTPSRNAQLSVPQYGTVTGLAFAGAAMFGVSDQGDLFRVGGTAFNVNSSANNGDFIETIYNTTTGQRVQFASLTSGPRNTESALSFSTLANGLGQILFGIDTTGVMYAFDTLGRPAHVFPDGRWFIQTEATNVSGLAFSNLDVNLWHESANRGAAADVGHGVNVSFDGSRRTQTNGGNSLYFGFDNPNDTLKQTGVFTGINNPIGNSPGYDAARENTYDFPGGAKGSVVSNSLDLSAYGPADKPTLYFNYYLQTENANASNPGDNNFMKDALRVFVSDQTGAWQLLATNNSTYDATRLVGQRDEHDYPFEIDVAEFLANPNDFTPHALNRQVSELYDVGDVSNGLTAPNSWRQARLDLSRFAGQKDVRIRFDFSTDGSYVNGGEIELTAVAASDIPVPVAQRRFVINDPARGSITFEFDFGLLLQIPSGPRLTIGDQFEVDGVTYTFAADNIGNNVLFSNTDSAETIAARILPKLTARGLNAVVDPVTRSRISVMNAVNTNPFVSPTLPAGFIADVPGTGANQRVLINSAMSATQVRDAIRTSFARAFNVQGQETNVASIRFNESTIYLWNKTVQNPGPLLFAGTALQGDEFGERDSRVTNTVGSGAQRGQINRFEGVYIDDIIVGFAEHGEMVTYQNNGTASVTTFIDNPRHEPNPDYLEVETGTYQIEIRRGFTYGVGGTNFPDLGLFQTFDTNDRGTQQVSLVAPRGSELTDGQTFQLSDGVDTVTYEYDDTSITSGPRLGVTQGNVRVAFLSSDSEFTIAQRIRDAINSNQSRAILDVVAGLSDGTVTGTTNTGKVSRSRIVHIHGRVAASNAGSSGFVGTRFNTATGANAGGFILYGIDTFRINEAGDANRNRDQGQIIVHSNIVRDSAGFGIVVDAGARTNNTLIPLAGVLPHPGSVRNLLQFNAEDLVPGTVIANNLVYAAAVGGILFSGDQRSAATIEAPVSFGRIVNNTIVGANGTGTGIRVTDNASPTLLNNIVSSLATGITVDGSSTTTVVGFTTYKGNASNVGGALVSLGDRPQILGASEPLFVNETLRNFYLAAGSRAIDSSMDSLNDRQSMTAVREPLGIAPSPILSPDFDIAGQLRKDDPNVSNPDGTGANPFKDRGAFERVDLSGLDAIIQQPLDNDPDILDSDRFNTYIRLTSGNLDYFSILLFESEGTGPDPRTVTEETVLVTENGRLLRPGVDYVFGYSPSSRQIRLTPLAGFWRRDSVYELTLVNQSSFRINTPRGSAINDGQQIRFNVGATAYVLEFDTGNGVSNGAIPIPYESTFTDSMVAGALMRVLIANSLAAAGVKSYAMADSSLMVTGVTNLTLSPVSSPLSVLAISPIADLAGNPLKPNRINTLTQFTILMPEVALDYGDAIERANTGFVSATSQLSNGARAAIYPIDFPVLAIGNFVDGDADGITSPAADADDFDSSISFSAGIPLSLSNRGPAKLVVSAPTAALLGKTFTITDAIGRSVTYEFTNGNSATGTNFAIDFAGITTAVALTTKIETAVRDSIDDGLITGIQSIQDSNSVGLTNVLSLGGGTSHVVNLASSGGFLQKLASGSVGIAVAADVSTLAASQTFTIADGFGNTVTFQVIDAVAPAPIVVGNISVPLRLTDPSTPPTQFLFATAVRNAINEAISGGRLRLPAAVLDESSFVISLLADDEDGVSFSGLFNNKSAPVTVSVVITGVGYLDGWIDWNRNNNFEPSEKIDFDPSPTTTLLSRPVSDGVFSFDVSTPASAVAGYTTARFRVSAFGALAQGGLSVGGEVEDHVIEIVSGEPPTARNDNYTVIEDTSLDVTAVLGILANDTDPDNDPISVFDADPAVAGVQPLSGPSNGTLVLRADGSFVYTPNANFSGVDSFVYQARDQRLVNATPATVTIRVTPLSDAPDGTNQNVSIDEDTIFTFSSDSWGFVDANDLPPNTLLDVTITTLPPAAEGTLVLGTTPVTAGQVIPVAELSNLTFRPAKDVNGPDRGLFTFQVRDNGSTANGGVTLDPTPNTFRFNIAAINDAPSFVVPASEIALTEDPGAQDLLNFVINVVPGPSTAVDEIASQTVTFRVQAVDPTRFVVQPTITPATIGNNGSGNLQFTLAPDVNSVNSGPILIEITADDQGGPGTHPNGPLSLTQTITLNITAVNDQPSFGISQDSISLDEDAGRVAIANFISSAPSPGPSTAVDEAGQATTLTVTAITPSLFAIQPRINAQTNELEFQLAQDVNSNFAGSLNILVTVADDGVPAASFTRTVTVNVNDINDAPFFTLSQNSVDLIEDAGPTSLTGFATNVRQAFNLTATDEVNQNLTFNMNFSNPTLFALPPAINAAGVLTFRTAPHQNGTSVVTARLVDDGDASPFPNNNLGPVLTFTISVQAVNDAPEFTIPTELSVDEDAGVVSLPGFATEIRPGPAVATDESRQSLAFNLDSFDPNLFEVPPTIQPDGTLSFRTRLNVNSSTPGINRVITFQLQDGGLGSPSPNVNLSVKKSFTLDIRPVNDSPIPDIHNISDVVEDRRTTVQASDVLFGDLPGPADEVNAGQTVRMTQVERSSQQGGTVIPRFVNGVDGDILSFDYIPPPNLVGVDTVRYVVTDNGSPERSATGTIVIRPLGVNDPPQFTPGPDLNILEDSLPHNQAWASNILPGPPNATDESSQTVSFIVTPSSATFFSVQPAISSSGVLTFTLAKDVNGIVTLDVFARDNGGTNTAAGDVNTSPTHRMTISIGAVNDPAGFVMAGPVVVEEDSGAYSAPFLTKIVPAEGMNSVPPTGTDEANQSVTVRVTNNNNALFAVQPSIDASGRLTFTPADNAFGSVEVYVEVVDNGPSTPPNVNTSARQTFTVTMSSRNDNPVANQDQYSANEDSVLTITAPGLLTNDLDPDLPNDTILVNVPVGTLNSFLGARVTLNADGSFSYDPRNASRLQELRAGETILDSFTYTIRDSSNTTSNAATVAITVSGANDAPVAVNDSFQIDVGATAQLDVLQNDTDVDSSLDIRSIEIGQLPANGTAIALSTGRVEFRSAAGFIGTNTFTYRVRDALGALSNEATVTVRTSNPPIAGNDIVSTVRNRSVDIDVLRNDSDPAPNGGLNPASVTIVTQPTSGTASVLSDGKIRFTPTTGFVGSTTLQYTVANLSGQVSNVATVTVQVLASLYQNPDNRLDVDDDGSVSAIDVLILVNQINAFGQRVLPEGLATPPYLDVDGDGSLTSLDVLTVVNFINDRGNGGAGEGESTPNLDWKPIDVEIMSPAGYAEAYKQYVIKESMAEFDLSLAKTLGEEFEYGPLLASDEGEESESLADYLAAWEDIDSDEDDLDSVFANSDWL